VAVILQHGMQRMLAEQQDEYYYLTLMNENYTHPEMPEGAAEGIIKGMYLLKDAGKAKKGELRVQLLGSGTILREVIAAAELLDAGVRRQVPTSGPAPASTNCARDGADAERWNRLHPEAKTPRKAWVTQQLEGRQGPAIAATDYVPHLSPSQIREFVPMRYSVLGTDGFGRSDTRANLRRHFEVDRFHVAHAAVAALGGGRQAHAEGRGARDQALQAGCGEAESDWGLSRSSSSLAKQGRARVGCSEQGGQWPPFFELLHSMRLRSDPAKGLS
jgi:pyruvate dehydrogenase E1 component